MEWLTRYTLSGVTYTVHFEWSELHSTLRVEWLTQYYTSSGESDSVTSAFESRNRYPLAFTSRVFALFETGYIEWSNFFSNDNYQQYTHIYVYIASILLLDLHWSIMKMKMKPNINMYKKLSANILILLWTRFEISAGIFDNLCLFQKQDGPESDSLFLLKAFIKIWIYKTARPNPCLQIWIKRFSRFKPKTISPP